jgi:threonine dehydratase
MPIIYCPDDPMPSHRLRLRAIAEAPALIDRVFLGSPYFDCEPLGEALGCEISLKVETLNPIRSFKGRGASLLVESRMRNGELVAKTLVGASAGNWGQALAHACRRRGVPLVMYAAVSANPLKIERILRLGAEVRLHGADFDAAKIEAESFAAADPLNRMMVADGLDPEASEGAGTIALEMLELGERPDIILVPLGNGAMLTGIARWAKAIDGAIRIVGVQAKGADAMERSWRLGDLVFPARVDTIADGIGVRVPIGEAVEDMRGIVDDVLLVEDETMLEAMRLLHRKAGLLSEPSGAAGIAPLIAFPSRFKGARVATILCGSNITTEQFASWRIASD